MSDPLKLFWWRKQPNFGDAIAPRLVGYASGREVSWAHPEAAELVGIGSLLGMVKDRLLAGDVPHVWGSGSIHLPVFLKDVGQPERFAAVRGLMTASHLNGFAGAVGDPGLLCDRVQPRAAETGEVGIVPHYTHWRQVEFIDSLRASGHRVIDVRRGDPWDVVAEISGCSGIVSNSLHGLIVADAYGIPNTWLEGPEFGPNYKFFDYFYTVGRRDARPLPLKTCLRHLQENGPDRTYMAGLETIKDGLIAAFPAALKERQVA